MYACSRIMNVTSNPVVKESLFGNSESKGYRLAVAQNLYVNKSAKITRENIFFRAEYYLRPCAQFFLFLSFYFLR